MNPLDLNLRISDKEFLLMRNLIYDTFGINLSEDKKSLIPGRLQGLMRKLGFETFHEYYEYVKSDKTANALIELVNLISTNHTFFYREKDHFEYFQQIALPDIIRRLEASNLKDLRIWCAGCSTGEEPYLLMMLMKEVLGPRYSAWDAGLLASDISEKVLMIARAGIYSEDRMELLPGFLKHKYFRKLKSGQQEVIDDIKKEIVFRRFNLMNKKFPFKKKFHIIFCRNVMIYFDQKTRDELINRFADCLEDNGYLFIGHSETLGRDQTNFKFIKPALYIKRNGLT
jgi:chemotaxis protein methyltransferase CheR